MRSDWMPSRREQQLEMARVWLTVLYANSQRWGLPDNIYSQLEKLTEDADDALRSATSPGRNPVTTAAAQAAFRALVAFMRDVRDRYFKTPPLTDVDLVSLGLRPRDLIRTPHIDVTEVVEFELKLRNIREILVHFWVKGETHRAKPQFYDGAVIVWGLLDEPPARPDDLINHTMASRTPHALEFDETERGKAVYIAASWQNERGNIGQWSEIQSAVIP